MPFASTKGCDVDDGRREPGGGCASGSSILFITNREHSFILDSSSLFRRTITVVAALGYHDTDHCNCIGAPAAGGRHHNLHCNYMHLQEA